MRGIRFGLGPSLPSHDGPLKATRVLRMPPDKSTRVNKHMVESGHHSATKADRSHWKRNRGSLVLKEQ